MSFSVVAFTGGLIGEGERSAWVTDFHVVDERGRTVAVYPHAQHGSGSSWVRNRLRKARLHAARLNGPLGYVPSARRDQASYSFRPTCPHCSDLCPIGARHCPRCETYLYLTDDDLGEL